MRPGLLLRPYWEPITVHPNDRKVNVMDTAKNRIKDTARELIDARCEFTLPGDWSSVPLADWQDATVLHGCAIARNIAASNGIRQDSQFVKRAGLYICGFTDQAATTIARQAIERASKPQPYIFW